MRILVAVASKHGATEQIAVEVGQALSNALRERGVEVDVRPVEEVRSFDPYAAAVIGSAVYVGHWMEPARHLVRDHADVLAELPVWLFSSGPIGDPLKPDDPAVDVTEELEWSRAREHVVFAGKIDKGALGFGERAIVRALKVPQGDFRNWTQIREWAEHIAGQLEAEWSKGDS